LKEIDELEVLLEDIIEENEGKEQILISMSRVCGLWSLVKEAQNHMLDHCLGEYLAGLTTADALEVVSKIVNPIIQELRAEE